ncbi:MAG: tol-pal system protein YbgF [Nitrospira sp.]|nr:tol-pal system protein YbgF [Nitrospira sp.]
MCVRTLVSGSVAWGLLASTVMLAGCAKHADFMEMRNQLSTISRTQDQDHQRVDAAMRRLEAVERSKESDPAKVRFDDLTARVQKLESRLVKLEEVASQVSAKADATTESRASRSAKQTPLAEPTGTVSGITPTSAFNLAYNDYLNGKYELAVAGFQRFIKDFPGTSLTPNAHYWLGESYYNLKDYGRAIHTFDSLVAEYPGNEKIPAALYKLGLATAETGDLGRSRKSLKRVLEEFPSSDESKLAKNKLAEIR